MDRAAHSEDGLLRRLPEQDRAKPPPNELIHQAVPTSSFDAVLQRQHHALRPHRSFHPRPVLVGFCTLCSPCWHSRRCLCLGLGQCASTFLPTFPQRGFASRASRGSSPLQYYAGSDPCRTSPARQASLLTLHCLPGIPPPITSCARTSLCQSPQRVRSIPFGFRLRQDRAGSPHHAAESGSSSYRLPLRLRLLPTPPRGDAVAFGFIRCDLLWHGLAPC